MEITAEVSLYQCRSMAGGRIGKYTQVKFSDGVTVRFLERLGKKEAIRIAQQRRQDDPARYSA